MRYQTCECCGERFREDDAELNEDGNCTNCARHIEDEERMARVREEDVEFEDA